MPINNLRNLITELHDSFGDIETSPQQQQLMRQLQQFSHNLDEAEPTNPNFTETAEILLEDIKETYPKSAAIIREVIHALGNMGV